MSRSTDPLRSLEKTFQLAEVRCNDLTDLPGGERSCDLHDSLTFKVGRVCQARAFIDGLEDIGQRSLERPECSADREVPIRLERRDLEVLVRPRWDRSDLTVRGPDSDGALGRLAGLDDGVVSLRHVLELSQELEDVVRWAMDDHRGCEVHETPSP